VTCECFVSPKDKVSYYKVKGSFGKIVVVDKTVMVEATPVKHLLWCFESIWRKSLTKLLLSFAYE
jgi:hypothetical protein